MSRWLIASEEPKGTVNESNYSKTQTDNTGTLSVLEKDIFPNEEKIINPGYSNQDTDPTQAPLDVPIEPIVDGIQK